MTPEQPPPSISQSHLTIYDTDKGTPYRPHQELAHRHFFSQLPFHSFSTHFYILNISSWKKLGTGFSMCFICYLGFFVCLAAYHRLTVLVRFICCITKNRPYPKSTHSSPAYRFAKPRLGIWNLAFVSCRL